MTDENYYKVGGSLEYQHPTYVVRQADSDLYEGLKNGEFCYVLNSRQMGKSSLRVQMMKKLKEQGFKCASIDMTRIGSHVTPQEWYAGVVSELLRGFSLSRKVNFSSWWRERELLPPLQRLREFIEDVLLVEFDQNLVIFLDEIDSILKIKFKDDFFAFIRACYNQRVDNSDYKRLTFCLLGVATPSDLIADKQRTPFNIGRAIELAGFKLEEAQSSLTEGLTHKLDNPEKVVEEVLSWTDGQPFLTQKLCQLVVGKADSRQPNIEQLVQQYVINNWEAQDEPEHLRTIRDRILSNEQRAGRLLGLYQQILQQGDIAADESPEQVELRLSGLVVKEQGSLRIYNRIYETVFNLSWVENELANLRPYSQAIAAWLASNRQDGSRLLREQALKEALHWAADKSLSVLDYAFLAASQELALQDMQRDLEAERQAGAILASAKQQAYQLLKEAKEGTKIERAGVRALRLFEVGGREIEALLLALQAGLDLHKRVQDGRPLQDYPASSPLLALQLILDNIRERNQFLRNELIARFGKSFLVEKGFLFQVRSVIFSPNGKYFAAALDRYPTRLWDLFGNQIAEFNEGGVTSVSFSPDGKYIATASDDRTARLWDLSGKQVAEFKGHQGEVTSVSFSPDRKYLATASRDKTARLWDLSGKQVAEFKGHQGEVTSVSFSPDGKYLVTASDDHMARLWNLSGNQVAEFKGHQGGVTSVSFSSDGKYLVTASRDNTARLWDSSVNRLTQSIRHGGKVLSISFSPNGEYLATASRGDCTPRLWDLSDKQLIKLKRGHRGGVTSVSFSPDGKYLITGSRERTVGLWDLTNKKRVEFKGKHQGRVWSVSFSPNGKLLATASDDGTARLWDLSGNQLAEFKEHQGEVWKVSFSPNGDYLATTSRDCTARLWDLSGNQLAEFRGHESDVWSVSFSPRGDYLATASDDSTARLWDLSGNQLAEFKGHRGGVWSISFSPDGEYLATGSRDCTARLWDLSGNQIAEFKGHQGGVRSVSFSPNGKLLATASEDYIARLWRVEGLDELLCRGCDWLKYYFASRPEALEKLEVCQKRFNSDCPVN